MSDFKAKMHQIIFRLGVVLHPRTRWGSLQRSPRPSSRGPTSKGEGKGQEEKGGREGREGEEKGKGREGMGREGGGWVASPQVKACPPLLFSWRGR